MQSIDFIEPADCNENPADECVNGSDDHPLNLVTCYDCRDERRRDESTPWGGAYLCRECMERYDQLPFAEGK